MDVEIRYVKKSEAKELIAFNKRNYRAGHILTDKQYLDWQFGSFPSKRARYTVLGAFGPRNEMLGTLGLTFLDYWYFGKKVRAASFANLMVDKRLRNLGLGYLLMRAAEKMAPFAVDHGLNEDAIRLFEGRGWVGEDLRRYAFVFNSANVKRVMEKENAAIKDSVFGLVASRDLAFVRLETYDKRLAVFFKKMRNKYPITVQRSKQYLNWRYFNHPLISYSVFAAAGGGNIESFAVVRMEGPARFRAGRIIDFVSLDRAEACTLVGILDFCRQKKANFVDYYFSGNFHIKSLRQAGFSDASSGAYALLPKLLNPVVNSPKNGINFFVTTPGVKDQRVKNLKHWYTTKGGGDQDRAY